MGERSRAEGTFVSRARRCTGTAARLLAALLFLPAGAAGDEPLEQTFEVKPDVRVDIEILSGSIEVRAIDADEVRLRSEGGGGLEIDGSRRRVSIRAPATGWFPWSRGVDVELQIEVPRESRLTIRSINGRIRVEGVEGELHLHAANGEIDVEGTPREAYLETMTGAIRFEGERSTVVARTINGEVRLQGVAGEVEVSTVSGAIRVEGEDLERADLRTMSGEIELRASLAPRARVEARSYSGAVRLGLPADTSARFEVQSFSGGVHSEFASRLEGEDRKGSRDRGRGRPLSFVVGDGDARVTIESFSGGVRIEEQGG